MLKEVKLSYKDDLPLTKIRLHQIEFITLKGVSIENHRMHQTSPGLGGESQSRGWAGQLGGRAIGHQPVRRVRRRRRATTAGSRQRLNRHRTVHRTRVRTRGAQARARHGCR